MQRGDKPYNAICELNSIEFMKKTEFKELINIFESMYTRTHARSIGEFNDYK